MLYDGLLNTYISVDLNIVSTWVHRKQAFIGSTSVQFIWIYADMLKWTTSQPRTTLLGCFAFMTHFLAVTSSIAVADVHINAYSHRRSIADGGDGRHY